MTENNRNRTQQKEAEEPGNRKCPLIGLEMCIRDRIRILPPPRDSPRTVMVWPAALVIEISTVLG